MGSAEDRAPWLYGDGASCDSNRTIPDRTWRVILLGAPGVGKGTQAEMLSNWLGACHLSTGDIFRAARCLAPGELTPAMREALGYMKRGELVPDDIVIALVSERLRCLKCMYGFLLDGFPRTLTQAQTLDALMGEHRLTFDAVLSFDLDEAEVIERLSGRRTCLQCKTTFHLSGKPPRTEGVCDRCGGALYQREDDCPEAIAVRLRAYRDSAAPLEEYYERKGLLRRIDASGTPEEVFSRAMAALERTASPPAGA
ncbi:MAG: adenylate kinase [Candidatus Sumerlaeia bacterium]